MQNVCSCKPKAHRKPYFSGIIVRALAAEIKSKEEYGFLKGNKEPEAIFEEYLK